MTKQISVGQLGLGLGEAMAVPEAPRSREQRRSMRKRVVKARTINVKRLTKHELMMGRLMYPEEDLGRPKTRGECPEPGEDGKRRCPWAGCRYHLYLDVSHRTGAIKLNFPDIDDPTEIPQCCALDVADDGGTTLEEVGRLTNVVRERIRQIERQATATIRPEVERRGLRGSTDAFDPKGKRHLTVLQPGEADALSLTEADEEISDEAGRSHVTPRRVPGTDRYEAPVREAAKRLAYELVSFRLRDFKARFENSVDYQIGYLVKSRYVEKLEGGSYVITAKLENEMAEGQEAAE